MSQIHQILPHAWNALPDTFQSRLSGNPVHQYLQRQVAYNEDLVYHTISPTSDFSFEMPVPERLGPWWLDFDSSKPHSCHEPITTRTLIDEIDTGDVVWDFGSQWGYFSVLAAALNDAPENVHVFDMEPFHCLQIQRTSDVLYGENGLSVVETRIGDSDGPSTTCGDAYMERSTSPDVVKIDIEGAEVPAIDGMSTVLESARPTLLVEVHPNKIRRHFQKSESTLLETLDGYYDDISYATEFRRQDAEWAPLDGTASPVATSIGMDGNVDRDSYQLLCRP